VNDFANVSQSDTRFISGIKISIASPPNDSALAIFHIALQDHPPSLEKILPSRENILVSYKMYLRLTSFFREFFDKNYAS